MKPLLLRSVTIIHPDSSFNGDLTDVLIENGKIAAIATGLPAHSDAEIIDGKGKYLSPGFFDLNVNFGEPGFETKENLESGSDTACAGGFTGVAVMPNTQPAVQSKSEVTYIVNKTTGGIVDVYPLGAISLHREGKNLAEMYDMKLAGAIAFTDGNRPVTDSGLMSRAMLYAKGFEGLIFSYPEDRQIAGNGKMNEGKTSTYLGMKGIPSLAEELMVSRDIFLAEYNDAKVHFSTISSAGSVNLIREAKKKGLTVTCDVAAHQLVLTEEVLSGFDSNYKTKPPLRTTHDRDMLLEGLLDGTIDAVVSQHTPHEVEFKDVEFEIALYGISALQTVLPLLLEAGMQPELIVQKLAVNPRKIVGLPVPQFEVGHTANMVLFDTEEHWEFNRKTNLSMSYNTPFLNQTLKGKVLLVCNNKQRRAF